MPIGRYHQKIIHVYLVGPKIDQDNPKELIKNVPFYAFDNFLIFYDFFMAKDSCLPFKRFLVILDRK